MSSETEKYWMYFVGKEIKCEGNGTFESGNYILFDGEGKFN